MLIFFLLFLHLIFYKCIMGSASLNMKVNRAGGGQPGGGGLRELRLGLGEDRGPRRGGRRSPGPAGRALRALLSVSCRRRRRAAACGPCAHRARGRWAGEGGGAHRWTLPGPGRYHPSASGILRSPPQSRASAPTPIVVRD